MQESAGGWWNKIFIGIFGHGFVDSSLFIFLCIFFLFYIFYADVSLNRFLTCVIFPS